ncbi:MAG: TadA family conjugal transfer-associated ATPase [Ancrocorticia sp.]|uniref:TadA family conjugal transfer-associated ATPase n=1 Tax=Ancrocorticia sp. TaxID=2593684 RepID=UPI003F8DF4E5
MARLSREQVDAARAVLASGAGVSEALDAVSPEYVGIRDVLNIGGQIRHALAGAGPHLQPLLDDPAVTDVLVNGAKGIWIDRGRGLERVKELENVHNAEDVRELAVRLAAACGQRLDDSSPVVDGTFSGGLRLHAVLPPLAAEGTLISLRTHRPVTFGIKDLDDRGMLSGMGYILEAIMQSRANAMISGSTGSGKTTLLAALLATVPPTERILIIEEAFELRPRHPHVVHLQERRENVQGAGAVSMSELVRAAMRMRPDRIVLGECRGSEVRDVLSALNTGHEGGWATIHANSAVDVPARLVALGALANMNEAVVAAQAASALDAVIHVERQAGVRRISQIAVLQRRGQELAALPAVEVRGDGRLSYGPGWERLAKRLDLPAAEGASASGTRRRRRAS